MLNLHPEYPKIETLFERDENFVVDPTKLKNPVLGTIDTWDVTEKIDGTNIRVMLSEAGEVSFGGRTAKAEMATDLLTYLIKTFPAEKIKTAFWTGRQDTPAVTLYGEGYGAGIQKGGAYRPDKAFILFDVLLGGNYWVPPDEVNCCLPALLEIQAVPYLARMSLPEMIDLTKRGFASKIGTARAEGLVARPIETLYDQYHRRIIIKLKTKDFEVQKITKK